MALRRSGSAAGADPTAASAASWVITINHSRSVFRAPAVLNAHYARLGALVCRRCCNLVKSNRSRFLLLIGFFLARGGILTQTNVSSQLSIPMQFDEFVGPFSSWTNVKTTYGAVGDGIADDGFAL